ncbi:MAG TPA: BTAD domain-containing putative transcriptional regulator [Pseudonocardiaceae bacterium]|nr:BTAD domain-containing putative transcriptional regulator [Pseudonocardiaceae bacterium]
MSSTADSGVNAGPIYFELLGPISIVHGDNRKQLSSHRQRVILAALLLSANRVVPVDTLIDAVWGERPPATARSQVYICMTAIRGTLREFAPGELVVTEPTGYFMRLEPDQLDMRRFERMCSAATRMADRGQLAEAVVIQRRALDLWRGPALSGVSSPLIETQATRLDEDRLVAQDICAEWELRLGRHREMISELAERVAAHPLRERSRAQLMLALHRSGRQAEALETYRRGRQELIDQLGLEPGEELRRMEALILSDDAELQVAEPVRATLAPVRQLPTDTADFVGRDELIDEVSGLLNTTLDARPGTAVPVVVASGLGGVGKSALVVHVAHMVAGRCFADGQLYANLSGPSTRPRRPGEVLSRFLQSFGVRGGSLPDDDVERAELYRSLLADRHVLVVLEDASSEAQVRPLLPGSPSCAVLITSRHRLTGLAGAHHIDVSAFGEDQAADLLAKIIGPARVSAERDQVGELTRLVDGLPLALRIIGSRLSSRPHWTLKHMTRLLADESGRLDELAHRDLGVRTTISLTYNGLLPQEQLLLRSLCDFDADSIPGWVAAAALDVDQTDAMRLLDNLTDANLVRVVADDPGAPIRYRVHDLVRIFAAEQAAADPADLRSAAQARICGGWLWLAEQAHERLYGGQFTVMHGSAARWESDPLLAELTDPLQWLDAERANLLAAVRNSAAAGLDELSWDLAMTLVTLFEARSYVGEWEETHLEALAAARRAGNRRAEAAMLCSLGSLYLTRGQTGKAQAVLIPALRAFIELDDAGGRALAARNIATMHHRKGEFRQAQQRYRQALADFRLLGDHIGEAHVLVNLAGIDLDLERVDTAVTQLEEALRLSGLAGHRRTEAQAMYRMGEALVARGELRAAGETLRGALAMVRDDGDRMGQMHVLRGLGRMHLALGQLANAEYCAREAMALAREVGDRQTADQIRSELATVLARLGGSGGATQSVQSESAAGA